MWNFYPRPPRGGRRASQSYSFAIILFLSTSPAWGTTHRGIDTVHGDHISIHVPRVGDDTSVTMVTMPKKTFLSTSPAWGTTPVLSCVRGHDSISIHVPRVGDDNIQFGRVPAAQYFYPRPPRGGRRRGGAGRRRQLEDFYPRPPRGGRRGSSSLTRKRK